MVHFGVRLSLAIAASLIGLGSGMAVAGLPDEPAVALPERLAGDEVVYRADPGDQRFRQMQIMPWKDGAGSWHAADAISLHIGTIRMNGYERELIFYSLLDASGDSLAAATGGGGGSSSSSGIASSNTASQTNSLFEAGATLHPCGFANSLQGSAGDTMRASGNCLGGAPSRLKLLREDQWNDDSVTVFGANRQDERVEVWVRNDLPYPVRIVREGEEQSTMDLVGLRRGHDALQAPELPDDTPIPTPAWVSFDGDAVPLFDGLEYSLRDALADARASSEGEKLETFEREHPDATVMSAEMAVDGLKVQWDVRIEDADEGLHMLIERRPTTLPEPLVGAGLVSRWDVEVVAFASGRGWWLAPQEWRMETVPLHVVVDAWRAYAGAEGDPTRIGFSAPRCNVDCAPDVFAGRIDLEAVSEPGLLEQPETRSGEGYLMHPGRDGYDVEWIHATESRQGLSIQPPGRAEGSTPAVSAWDVPPVSRSAAVGAGALIVGAATWFALGKFLPALVVRRPSEHPARRKLLALIDAQPGIHYQEIVRTTGMGNGAVGHHLGVLVDARRIRLTRHNRYACYFPAAADPHTMAAAGALKSEGARQILATIEASPGVAVSDVTAATGLSPGTVSHHLKRLRDGGVVDAWREGRTVRLRVASA